MADEGSGRYAIAALAKGLRVLSQFSERSPALRMAVLSERTDIPMPTLFRIVRTLEEEGYLEHLPDGSYRPNTKVLTLGFAAVQSLDLVQTSTGILRNLSDSTGETVNMGVLNADRVLYLVRLRRSDIVTANVQTGSTLPAAITSMGKILLAPLTDDEIARRLTAASFGGGGPKAVQTLEALMTQLVAVRKQGYAVQDEEVALGLRSIAAPIKNAEGHVIAAVNVAVHSSEYSIERLVSALRQPLMDTAASISTRLGHRVDIGSIA